MSGPDKKEVVMPIQDLAMRIYVDLVGRNTAVVEGSVKMSASASNLAALSIKLAEAFLQAQDEATAAKAPVVARKLEDSDVAGWLK